MNEYVKENALNTAYKVYSDLVGKNLNLGYTHITPEVGTAHAQMILAMAEMFEKFLIQ